MKTGTDLIFCIVITLMVVVFTGTRPAHSSPLPAEDTASHKNQIFSSNIHTVQVYPDGWEFSKPVIRLNSDEKLRLSFDDLNGDYVEYKYRYLHCDEKGYTSDLQRNLYVSGYPENTINDYEYSRNTLIPYTHYELVFPDEDMPVLRSGNYMIQVYTTNVDELSFEMQFFVVEDGVNIIAAVSQPSGMDDRHSKQELKLNLAIETGFNVHIPEANIHPRIFQNGSLYNALHEIKPVSVSGNLISYDISGKILFDGGNEFRNFDTKSLDYQSEFIQSIETEYDSIRIFLRPDKKRNVQAYKTEQDINGQFLVKNDKAFNSATEAEYLNVYFFVPAIIPYAGFELYLNGALTAWKMDDHSRLHYNFQKKGYELNLFLKQGYYNYQFVLYDQFTKKYDISAYEGNFYETENEYSIFVYYHDLIDNYVRLAGYKTISTSIK